MGFVKAVSSKFFDQVKNMARRIGLDASICRAVDENLTLSLHLFGLFLSHSPSQQVGGTKRKAGQLLGNLHHLLLVQNYAVRRLENRLNAFMQVRNRLATVFPVDKVVHHTGLKWTGPKERHQCHQFLKSIRLQSLDQLLHPS